MKTIIERNLPLDVKYILTDKKKSIPAPFIEIINKNFISFDNFKSEFIEMASTLKGSGYTFLVLDRNKVEGNIEFNHVVFGYDDDKNIINIFNEEFGLNEVQTKNIINTKRP